MKTKRFSSIVLVGALTVVLAFTAFSGIMAQADIVPWDQVSQTAYSPKLPMMYSDFDGVLSYDPYASTCKPPYGPSLGHGYVNGVCRYCGWRAFSSNSTGSGGIKYDIGVKYDNFDQTREVFLKQYKVSVESGTRDRFFITGYFIVPYTDFAVQTLYYDLFQDKFMDWYAHEDGKVHIEKYYQELYPNDDGCKGGEGLCFALQPNPSCWNRYYGNHPCNCDDCAKIALEYKPFSLYTPQYEEIRASWIDWFAE